MILIKQYIFLLCKCFNLHMLRKGLILFSVVPHLYFCSLFSFSQHDKELESFEQLINSADNSINVDFNKCLLFAEKAILKAEIEEDSEKRAKAYYYAAKSNVFYRNFEESSRYLEMGLREDAVKNNPLLKSLFLSLQASYYSRMSLFEQSFNSLEQAMKLVESRKDLESRLLTSNLYIYYADYFTEKKDYKKAHLYADKSIEAIEKIKSEKYNSAKRIFKNKPYIYFYKSWILLEEKKPEEAYVFIKKAYDNAIKDGYYYMALFYEIYGDYYYQTKNYSKAIDFYLKTVDNKKKFKQFHSSVDSKIASSYKALGDYKNVVFYLERSRERREIDRKEDLRFIQRELSKKLSKEKTDKVLMQRNNYNMIILIFLIFIGLLFLLIRKLQKLREGKRKIIHEQQIRLSQKKSKIKEKDLEIEKLQNKVSESLSELIDMVKTNSPHFWVRFQEVYPDFTTKMLQVNSTLKVSELTFCAYIYLGFTTKEIAEYTFKAVKTIENNRYNLRKRMGLNREEDFLVWMRKIIAED